MRLTETYVSKAEEKRKLRKINESEKWIKNKKRKKLQTHAVTTRITTWQEASHATDTHIHLTCRAAIAELPLPAAARFL